MHISSYLSISVIRIPKLRQIHIRKNLRGFSFLFSQRDARFLDLLQESTTDKGV